jgi:hypothetical protein
MVGVVGSNPIEPTNAQSTQTEAAALRLQRLQLLSTVASRFLLRFILRCAPIARPFLVLPSRFPKHRNAMRRCTSRRGKVRFLVTCLQLFRNGLAVVSQ